MVEISKSGSGEGLGGVIPRGYSKIGASPHRSRSTVLSPTDAVRHWPAKPSHLIQDVAREVDLSPPPCGTARSKAVSDDRLVPEERVLHAGLPMIARGLLPASPSSLLDRQDRAITSARPRMCSSKINLRSGTGRCCWFYRRLPRRWRKRSANGWPRASARTATWRVSCALVHNSIEG